MKPEFSQHIFEKYSNTNFMTNHPVEAELFHSDRRTDRNDEVNSYFSKFCKSVVSTGFKILLSPLFYCIYSLISLTMLRDLVYFPGHFPKWIFITSAWIFHLLPSQFGKQHVIFVAHFIFSPCMNKVQIIPYPTSGYGTRIKQGSPLQYT